MTFNELITWARNAVKNYNDKNPFKNNDIGYGDVGYPGIDLTSFWINLKNDQVVFDDRGAFYIIKVDETLSDINYLCNIITSSKRLSGFDIRFEIKRAIPNENVKKFIESLLV